MSRVSALRTTRQNRRRPPRVVVACKRFVPTRSSVTVAGMSRTIISQCRNQAELFYSLSPLSRVSAIAAYLPSRRRNRQWGWGQCARPIRGRTSDSFYTAMPSSSMVQSSSISRIGPVQVSLSDSSSVAMGRFCAVTECVGPRARPEAWQPGPRVHARRPWAAGSIHPARRSGAARHTRVMEFPGCPGCAATRRNRSASDARGPRS